MAEPIEKPRHQSLTFRIYGDNVTMMRCAWLLMLDELCPESETAVRLRGLLSDPDRAAERSCPRCGHLGVFNANTRRRMCGNASCPNTEDL
jgi:hypothetical protein